MILANSNANISENKHKYKPLTIYIDVPLNTFLIYFIKHSPLCFCYVRTKHIIIYLDDYYNNIHDIYYSQQLIMKIHTQ
jgi:hypothetical protein